MEPRSGCRPPAPARGFVVALPRDGRLWRTGGGGGAATKPPSPPSRRPDSPEKGVRAFLAIGSAGGRGAGIPAPNPPRRPIFFSDSVVRFSADRLCRGSRGGGPGPVGAGPPGWGPIAGSHPPRPSPRPISQAHSPAPFPRPIPPTHSPRPFPPPIPGPHSPAPLPAPGRGVEIQLGAGDSGGRGDRPAPARSPGPFTAARSVETALGWGPRSARNPPTRLAVLRDLPSHPGTRLKLPPPAARLANPPSPRPPSGLPLPRAPVPPSPPAPPPDRPLAARPGPPDPSGPGDDPIHPPKRPPGEPSALPEPPIHPPPPRRDPPAHSSPPTFPTVRRRLPARYPRPNRMERPDFHSGSSPPPTLNLRHQPARRPEVRPGDRFRTPLGALKRRFSGGGREWPRSAPAALLRGAGTGRNPGAGARIRWGPFSGS